MPRSLILGVDGQDGSYLAESLLRRGHAVTGIGRGRAGRFVEPSAAFLYRTCDLRDSEELANLVGECDPDFAFHCAAVHGPAGFQYEPVWRDALAVNTGALHVLLERARTARRELRVIYFGSAKMYSAPLAGTIDESTAVRASCLYGITKIASRDMLAYYRRQHNVNATNLVFFTHDSPRRPASFFMPKIARTIAAARASDRHQERFATLDFRNDWSDAIELMEIVADIAETSSAPELLIASGTTWHGREAAAHLFARYGLDASRHIIEDSQGDAGPDFRVCLDKLEAGIGRRPQRTIVDLVASLMAGIETQTAGSAAQ